MEGICLRAGRGNQAWWLVEVQVAPGATAGEGGGPGEAAHLGQSWLLL